MGSLIDFPARPATPHLRLSDALDRLSLTGLEATSDLARYQAIRALRFPFPDGRPHPDFAVQALRDLASVPSELPASYRHARSAALALVELLFPDTIPAEVA